jgi:hypothetical protein
MAQLHIRLSDEDKADWKEYAESEGYGSLSRFVRTAVAKEKDDDSRGNAGHTAEVVVPDNVAKSEQINQLDDRLLKLVDRLEEIDNRLEQLERDRERPHDTRAVLEALPQERPNPEQIDQAWVIDREPTREQPNAGTAFDGTPESIARITNDSPAAIRHFLAQVVPRSEDIKMGKIDGQIRYWRVDDDE